MPRFIHLMEQIHAIVGNRLAYVADFHGAYPGLVYFVADLNPAPIASDEYDGSTLTKAGIDGVPDGLPHQRAAADPGTRSRTTSKRRKPGISCSGTRPPSR